MAKQKLWEETRDVIRGIEKKTGLSISVRASKKLIFGPEKPFLYQFNKTKSRLTLWYKDDLRHFNYEIAHELLSTFRYSQGRKKGLKEPIVTQKTGTKAFKQILKDIKGFNQEDKEFVIDQFETIYISLIRQLTKVPGNCWITKHIYENYPRLREESIKILEGIMDR